MTIMHKCETTIVTRDTMTLPMIMCHFEMNDICGLTNDRDYKRDLCGSDELDVASRNVENEASTVGTVTIRIFDPFCFPN